MVKAGVDDYDERVSFRFRRAGRVCRVDDLAGVPTVSRIPSVAHVVKVADTLFHDLCAAGRFKDAHMVNRVIVELTCV